MCKKESPGRTIAITGIPCAVHALIKRFMALKQVIYIEFSYK